MMIKQTKYQSVPSQSLKLTERRSERPYEVECCSIKIVVNPGVYQTSGDTELMTESVEITKNEKFLEVGCGTGVVSIVLAQRALEGIGVDININAVQNSVENAKRQIVHNVKFFASDVFDRVDGKFDVIICNPPYTQHEAKDNVDRMFWDPKDEMKRKFFRQSGKYLTKDGKIYFGWADFGDIDVNLPFSLAAESGYRLTKTFKKPHGNEFTFYVFQFARNLDAGLDN